MTTKPTPPQESALKLTYRGALPDILRLIATELENGNAHAEDFTNKSVEDISEEIQGVELPQRSKRFKDMMKAAEQYFAILEKAKHAPSAEQERFTDGLTTASPLTPPAPPS